MPEGTHWEWRGFGTVTRQFQAEFDRRELKFASAPAWDEPTDEYIWIPGCDVNVKVRSGGAQQQGLKLKRLKGKQGDLELWFEDPKELFPFKDLTPAAVTELGARLGLKIVPPPSPPTAASILNAFKSASPTPSIVTVVKRRQTRTYSATVQIELAYIKSVTVDGAPVALGTELASVAVENSIDVTNAPADEVAGARNMVDDAVTSLKLRDGGFAAKNYLDATAEWAAAVHA